MEFRVRLLDIRFLLPDDELGTWLDNCLVNQLTSQRPEDNSVEINVTVTIRARAKCLSCLSNAVGIFIFPLRFQTQRKLTSTSYDYHPRE